MQMLKIEFYKLRHRKMGLMLIGMGIFQLLFMIWMTKGMDAHELEQGWESCLYSLSQLDCMIMPLFIAMIASRLSDIEHKGNTFKCLKTIVPSSKLFNIKVLYGSIYLLALAILQIIILLLISSVRGFNESMPVGYLIYYSLSSLLIGETLFILQLSLSLLMPNQMIAFMVAIAGTFLGLYSMFFSEKVARWILWGYYALLAPIRMNWDSVTRIVDFYWITLPVGSVMMICGILVVLYIVGIRLFIRREN